MGSIASELGLKELQASRFFKKGSGFRVDGLLAQSSGMFRALGLRTPMKQALGNFAVYVFLALAPLAILPTSTIHYFVASCCIPKISEGVP